MSGRSFVDTNVLVYAVDDAEPTKRDVARRLLSSGDHGELVLSAQVLSEFYVTVTRKLAKPLTEATASDAVRLLALSPTVPIDADLVHGAIETSRSAQLSYWDGMIVAAAERARCEVLLSEDLSHGRRIGSVRIENPFRG